MTAKRPVPPPYEPTWLMAVVVTINLAYGVYSLHAHEWIAGASSLAVAAACVALVTVVPAMQRRLWRRILDED